VVVVGAESVKSGESSARHAFGPLENRSAAVARKLRRLANVIEAGGPIEDLALSLIVLLTVELAQPRWPAGDV
jgi:hypothetical protein